MSITKEDILSYMSNEQWSNAACCGYMIMACENIGYSKAQIETLLDSMQNMFNQKTVEQAEKKYYD